MSDVFKALNNSQNALLESPTGTGKTLCLLTASLAWLKKERARLDDNDENKKLPRIIYASRTHSQLTQVQEELKACGYNPRMILQASRDKLCINDKVKRKGNINGVNQELFGQALNLACASSSCRYKPAGGGKDGMFRDIE